MLVVAGREIIIPFSEQNKFIKPRGHWCWGTNKQFGDWRPMIPKQNGCLSLEI